MSIKLSDIRDALNGAFDTRTPGISFDPDGGFIAVVFDRENPRNMERFKRLHTLAMELYAEMRREEAPAE